MAIVVSSNAIVEQLSVEGIVCSDIRVADAATSVDGMTDCRHCSNASEVAAAVARGVAAKPPSCGEYPLTVVAPVSVLSDNVRRCSKNDLTVSIGPFRCAVGDVVLGLLVDTATPSLCLPCGDCDFPLDHGTCIVAAPVGNRLSGTHANGTIPADGLAVEPGHHLAWLAAESGLVGVARGATGAHAQAEQSVPFIFVGVLHQHGARVSVRSLAPTPTSICLSVPVVCVGATAAELGKTTLASGIIRGLSQSGLRVVGIKATGTGGSMDCRHHRKAGAVASIDQVDAGLPTTYSGESDFIAIADRLFLLAQDSQPDVIVCELGGDVIWANNPALLRNAMFEANLVRLYIVAGDTLADVGVRHWVAETAPALLQQLAVVCSPFRNLGGSNARCLALGLPVALDPNDVASIVSDIRARLQK